MKIILTVSIDIEEGYEDVHITDNHGHSCNYGDSNYDNGLKADSVGDCVTDFVKDYHNIK